MQLQRLVLIHALSGFGHSTMSVILPVVSAMGIQGCPLPTAVFSNHTGFPGWHKVDLTAEMMPHIKAWNTLQLTFDGIYSGYLGSGAQAETVLQLVQSHPESIFFLDPVMGDHGKLYSAITPEHVAAMKELTHHAGYLLPNITEACILTDTVYQEDFTDHDILVITKKLHAMGPKHVVITGIRKENLFINYLSEYQENPTGTDYYFDTVSLPAAGTSRPGTGDIFGSVLISCILKGQSLKQSVWKAAQFVADCIRVSDLHQLPPIEGTCFELLLSELTHLPESLLPQ